jgi:5-formyltetrahydrofolate cyclo-ligase
VSSSPGDPADGGVGRAKREARAAARARLAAMTPAESAERSRLICERLAGMDAVRRAVSVFLFLSAGPDEPDLIPLARNLRVANPAVVIAAPRVDWAAGSMTAVELTFDHVGIPQTEVRRHGVPEPVPPEPSFRRGASPVVLPAFDGQNIDVVLVPGLAFDAGLGRLGRGGGFYDRWLAGILDSRPTGHRATVVGVCFDVQVVDAVPVQPHDVRMDAVATDRRLMMR